MIRLREWIFSANSFVAAMLALFLSLALGFERPFWAMATVYIVSQPLAGTVRSKAVYRFGGTVVGAIATVFIVPTLSNAPVLLTLALALWVCACQFLSLLDRTPRSYFFMLAGYTAAIIGFPSVDHPDQIFTVAVLRAQEIGVGVMCATLVHTIVFPRGVAGVLRVRLDGIARDTRQWVLQALSGTPTPPDARERRSIAADITELHMLSTHVPYDTDADRPMRAALAALQDRLMLLVPLVSALEDRVLTLAPAMTDDMTALLAEVRQWVEADDRSDPAPLQARIDAVAAATQSTGWDNLLAHNLLARLHELVDLLVTARALNESLTRPRALAPDTRALVDSRLKRPLHVDLGMALLSTLATFAAIAGSCAFWIATAWPEGYIVPMIAAVMCCFFATMDDPTVAQRSFRTWTVVCLPLIAVYQFAILPMVDGFVMLTLVLAPTLLFLGALQAVPKWTNKMLPVVMGFATGLALTNTFSADFSSFAGANFAQLGGVAAAIFATRILRVVGPQTVARRVLRACWRELADMAAGRTRPGTGEWTGLMLDRIQLLAPRLSGATRDERLVAADALRDLRIGINVIVLREASEGTDATGTDTAIDNVLHDVARHFSGLAHSDSLAPEPALKDTIDTALNGKQTLPVLVALTGLRRNLFPDAAAPELAA